MAEVILKNVTKSFPGGNVAVRDFNLHVLDKEFVILVGPSGCGKSTTLRMIAGLEEITGGEIFIDGKLINNVSPKDRDIAMVFQNYALYPHMTVYDNMGFALKLRKIPKKEIDARVRDAAGILGIGDLLDRLPKKLSGGQRQRVAVGRAIVRNPKVFLFDEPLSNLDAKLRVVMRAELKKLHQDLGCTMIYVTHDQTEAMTMGDKLVVMKDGLVQQVADPISLYEKPVNRFTAGFIGSPAMNFIDGVLEADGENVSFRHEVFTQSLPGMSAGELSQHLGGKVILGIRPENVCIGGEIPASVEVVEPLGNEIILHVSVGGSVFVARVPPDTASLTPGHQLFLKFPAEKIHLFDRESGESLSE